jgi:glycosyltransferase involved in cell wall biosynthesis
MISIITVVYNGEKTIKDTLDSVCCQSLLPAEYIIVDGLSTDGTIAIVKEYMLKYPFIKYISEKDSGIYDAMNKGIQLANGKLIGIINSDDWYETNALEKMWDAYVGTGSGIYYGIQRNIIDEKEFYLERASHEFLAEKMIPHPSTFVSSDIYKEFGVFDLKFAFSADLELLIRFSKLNIPFYKLDSIISNFRIGGASSTPKAAMESLVIRKNYGHINLKRYYFSLFKFKLKLLMNY